MVSISITTASLHRACSSQQITKKVSSSQARIARSQAVNVITPIPDIETLKLHQNQPLTPIENDRHPRFSDERWKNGTWDLNKFVKKGRMDWDSVIVAEARRRKFLELHPKASTNYEPVLFRSSIIPWWAWILHSHRPQAELLNGRAAMVGFFMGYIVDVMTGLDMVGQTGNFICKAALLVTVVGVVLFRKKQDLENVKKLTDEATHYDKQWLASWQNLPSDEK